MKKKIFLITIFHEEVINNHYKVKHTIQSEHVLNYTSRLKQCTTKCKTYGNGKKEQKLNKI